MRALNSNTCLGLIYRSTSAHLSLNMSAPQFPKPQP